MRTVDDVERVSDWLSDGEIPAAHMSMITWSMLAFLCVRPLFPRRWFSHCLGRFCEGSPFGRPRRAGTCRPAVSSIFGHVVAPEKGSRSWMHWDNSARGGGRRRQEVFMLDQRLRHRIGVAVFKVRSGHQDVAPERDD